MKINKEFIKLLTEEKLTMVFDLLGKNGLGMIVAGQKTLKSLDDLDDIFYTADFLEREKMILIKHSGNREAPHVGNCLIENIAQSSDRDIRHFHDTDEKLKKFYTKEIETNFTIDNFVKNGYKTDLQKERDRNFWLPIWIAIGTVVGVSLLTPLFGRYLQDDIKQNIVFENKLKCAQYIERQNKEINEIANLKNKRRQDSNCSENIFQHKT